MSIARAVVDSQVKVCTFVPGYGANEVFNAVCNNFGIQFPCSFNEESAFTVAHGASLVGARSIAIMKAHGIAKAANSIISSLCSGTLAAFLCVVVNDKDGIHSDGVFNLENYLYGLGMPFKNVEVDSSYNDIKEMVAFSERLKVPVAVIVDSEIVSKKTSFFSNIITSTVPLYNRDIVRNVVLPPFNKCQYQEVKARLANDRDFKTVWPAIPHLPDELPRKWAEKTILYTTLFSVFRKIRGSLVTGDIGTCSFFAYPPYDCIDIATYLGGSIPLAVGACLAGYKDVWAVTGDFAFMSSSHMGLLEAIQRKLAIKTLIIHNRTSHCTGGHKIRDEAFDNLCMGFEPFIDKINNGQNEEEVKLVLNRAVKSKKMKIVIVNLKCS